MAGATVHFILVMVVQTLLVLSLSFSDVRRRPLYILTRLTYSLSGRAEGEAVPTHVRTLSVDLWSLTDPP